MTIRGYIEPGILEEAVYSKLAGIGVTKNDYPINPYSIIQDEKIVLHEKEFENDNIRGMIVHGANASGIIINSNRCYVSRRFIAMHELAHYWFHPHDTDRICLEEYQKQRKGIEWQANHAAAYALMPKDVMITLFEQSNGDLEYMCNYLKVSSDSIKYRIKELKLVRKVYENPRNFCRDITNTYRASTEGNSNFATLENQWLYDWL